MDTILRENRKKELKERIFLEAVRLFKEKGYDNVTVQEIASVCGIAKGTFFNYFSKKEEILLYFGYSQIELLNQRLENYRDHEPPKEQIEHILSDLLYRFKEHGDLMKHAVVEIIKSAYLLENESKRIHQLQEKLGSIIHRAKQDGKLDSNWDSAIIASTIVSIYFHTMMSWSLLNQQNSDIGQLFRHHLDIVWKGINKE